MRVFYSPITLKTLIPRLIILGIIDVFAIQIAMLLGRNISPLLGIAIAIFTIIVNIVYLDDRLYPWRWIAPALAGMLLLIVYPIVYSLVIAFSNYSDGNNLTKQQVIDYYLSLPYSPADAKSINVYVYNRDGTQGRKPEEMDLADFRFWIIDEANKVNYVGEHNAEQVRQVAADDPSVGPLNAKGVPDTLENGQFILIPSLQGLGSVAQFFQNDPPVLHLDNYLINLGGRGNLKLAGFYAAKQGLPKYAYDSQTDTLIDKETGDTYKAEMGKFVPSKPDGKPLERQKGFPVFIGLDNLLRVVRDENVRDPFWRVFMWTTVFALGSVISTFALGLLFALILNSKDIPLRAVWRSLLIIPYAIPFWLTAVVWRGLFNPQFGQVNLALESLLGRQLEFFADPTLAKILILFVNLYLGFPYMMLISLGALQSIPADMYEAATIDGANVNQQFRFITLPMLLIAMGPLLVASFAFNFNNFTLIELVTQGGPPISSATVAGHTDILLSYTFRLAFGGSRGADYGFAAAIAIFIFIIVGAITFINFRFSRQLESVSENV